MKTRIIYTKFYQDSYVRNLPSTERFLFLYLISNSHIGLSDCYECDTGLMSFETGLNISQIQKILEKFQEGGKFIYYDGWVKILNCEKYNNYKGEKNEIAKNVEISMIPDRVSKYFDRVSIGYTHFEDTSINKKSEIINHKSEIKNKKTEIKEEALAGEIVPIEEVELRDIVSFYNEVFNKNVRSIKGFEKNFYKWREFHTVEEIKNAIMKARKDKFWKDKMTLTILFRFKNTNGEEVDYIEDIGNRDSNSSSGMITQI